MQKRQALQSVPGEQTQKGEQAMEVMKIEEAGHKSAMIGGAE